MNNTTQERPEFSITFHMGGDRARQGHNERKPGTIGNPDIKIEERKNNLILINEDLKKVYKKLFDEAAREYNKKTHDPSRIINNYFAKISNDEKKHTHYEIIVQIGKKEEQIPREKARDLLLQYLYEFKERNPNLYIYGAFLHMDEETPHLHVDFVPWATYQKGMAIRNCLSKAIEQQGIEIDKKNDPTFYTLQMKWEEIERRELRDLCEAHGVHIKQEQKGRRIYLEISEYKELMQELERLKEQQKENRNAIKQLQQEKAQHQEELRQLRGQRNTLRATIKKMENFIKELEPQIDQLRQQADQARGAAQLAIRQTTSKAKNLIRPIKKELENFNQQMQEEEHPRYDQNPQEEEWER